MKDPLLVDTPHPAAAWSCLAPTEAYDAAQGIGWIHDGHARNTHGGYLILLVTLWHVCSLQLDLSLQFHHVAGLRAPIPTATMTTAGPTRRRASSLSLRTSDGRLPRPIPLELVHLSPLLERLAAAWLSHSMHVSVLTSPADIDDDPLQLWLCESVREPPLPPPEDHAHDQPLDPVSVNLDLDDACVRDTGGGGERIHAWLRDTCSVADGLSDCLGLLGSSWDVGCANRSESPFVVVQMGSALAFLGYGPAEATSNKLDSLPSGPQVQVQARARDGQTWFEPASRLGAVAQVQDPHEARGVGVLVKALVQQNAGALLFLRTMVCVAALFCFVHSILVLGERPSLVARSRSTS